MKKLALLAAALVMAAVAFTQTTIVVAPKVKTDRELKPGVKFWFSTRDFESGDTACHIEWSFNEDTVVKNTVRGKQSVSGGTMIKKDRFATDKPFIFKDSGGTVWIVFDTDRGPMAILYEDKAEEITTLIYQLEPMKKEFIFAVWHFW